MAEPWSKHVERAWRESAPFWARHADVVRAMFAPITEALVGEAAPEPGHRVLDVAGGPGEPSLTVAGVVGASGLVVHTDVAPGMADAARAEARRRGLSRVRFALASGDALPFGPATFDRVVCRLGVMFFPDADRGLAEMARVARPGGRVALAVWGLRERNPFFAIPSDVAARYAPSPDPPDAPDLWRFGEPGGLAAMLERAGAAEVRERRIAFEVAAPFDFEAFWPMRVELSDTLRGRMAALSRGEAARLADEVREATREYFASGAARFPAEAVVVSGMV
jgi:SAM-dependent methyltransferase